MPQKKETTKYHEGFRKGDIKISDGMKKGFMVMLAFKMNTEKWMGIEMPLLPVLRYMWQF